MTDQFDPQAEAENVGKLLALAEQLTDNDGARAGHLLLLAAAALAPDRDTLLQVAESAFAFVQSKGGRPQ